MRDRSVGDVGCLRRHACWARLDSIGIVLRENNSRGLVNCGDRDARELNQVDCHCSSVVQARVGPFNYTWVGLIIIRLAYGSYESEV